MTNDTTTEWTDAVYRESAAWSQHAGRRSNRVGQNISDKKEIEMNIEAEINKKVIQQERNADIERAKIHDEVFDEMIVAATRNLSMGIVDHFRHSLMEECEIYMDEVLDEVLSDKDRLIIKFQVSQASSELAESLAETLRNFGDRLKAEGPSSVLMVSLEEQLASQTRLS